MSDDEPFTVADMRAAVERLRELDGTTSIHGWDANGSPVEERVFLVDVHANSVLGRWYREGRVHPDTHGHLNPEDVYRMLRGFDRDVFESFWEVLVQESAMVRHGIIARAPGEWDGTIGHLRDVRFIDAPLPPALATAPRNRHERRRAAAQRRKERR